MPPSSCRCCTWPSRSGDNTKVLRSQAHYNALSLAQRPMEMMIENEGLATVVNTGYASPSGLNADDRARFGDYLCIGFNAWEYLYYQNIDRSIPKEPWIGADAYFKSLVATKPGLVEFWAEYEGSSPSRSGALWSGSSRRGRILHR